jgi:hypothetical protein
MFNKQFPNRMMQSQNMYNGMRQNSQFPPMYQDMNYYNQNDAFFENRSMYSASTASSTQNMTQNLKKKILDDINSMLSGCIENIIPKLVDECADSIFAKISVELEKQAKEIDDIKSQITSFDEIISDKCNPNKVFTPLKNMKKAETNMNQVGKIVKDQKQMIDEFQKKEELLNNLRQQLEFMREKLANEIVLGERVNSQIRDKNVDLLDMKRFIDQKVNTLSNTIKKVGESGVKSNPIAQFDQIIGLIDKITEKTQKHSVERELCFKNLNHKTVYSDINIRVSPTEPRREERRQAAGKPRRKSSLSNIEFTF